MNGEQYTQAAKNEAKGAIDRRTMMIATWCKWKLLLVLLLVV